MTLTLQCSINVAIFVFYRPRRRRPMTVFVIVAIFNSSTVIEEERRHVIERYFRDFYAFFMRFLCVFYQYFSLAFCINLYSSHPTDQYLFLLLFQGFRVAIIAGNY